MAIGWKCTGFELCAYFVTSSATLTVMFLSMHYYITESPGLTSRLSKISPFEDTSSVICGKMHRKSPNCGMQRPVTLHIVDSKSQRLGQGKRKAFMESNRLCSLVRATIPGEGGDWKLFMYKFSATADSSVFL